MTFCPKSATALAFVLVLAACGGGAEEADETATVTTGGGATTAPAVAPATGETPAPGATPTEVPVASPTPAPTPTQTPAPAAAAAVTEPAAFAVCKACHSVEPGDHGIGPSLAGVFGAKAASQPGFDYSDPMESSGLVWNQATLDRYLEDPRNVVPGTTMAFGGVKDDAKRQAIIDYIEGL